jgi:hypothetical protein
LISRQYVATSSTNFLFDAFFHVTEPGCSSRAHFTAEFDVPVLEGVTDKTRLRARSGKPDRLGHHDERVGALSLHGHQWRQRRRVRRHAHELSAAAIRPGPCQKGISSVPYNLASIRTLTGRRSCPDSEAGHGRQRCASSRDWPRASYDDLEFVLPRARLQDGRRPSGQPPISASVCNTLASKWATAGSSYNKCINAAYLAETEHGRRELASRSSPQLTNFRSTDTGPRPRATSQTGPVSVKMRVDVILTSTTRACCRR